MRIAPGALSTGAASPPAKFGVSVFTPGNLVMQLQARNPLAPAVAAALVSVVLVIGMPPEGLAADAASPRFDSSSLVASSSSL